MSISRSRFHLPDLILLCSITREVAANQCLPFFIYFLFVPLYFPDASPNELLGHLNILKMCLLSALTVVFLLEGKREYASQPELQEAVQGPYLIDVIPTAARHFCMRAK